MPQYVSAYDDEFAIEDEVDVAVDGVDAAVLIS